MAFCDSAQHWLTIANLPGIGSATLCRLARHYGSPAALFSQVGGDADIAPRLARILTDRKLLRQAGEVAARQIELLGRQQVSLTCYDSPLYPEQLRVLADAPVLLFYQGDLSCLDHPSVALVGARAATTYGREVSFNLATGLAEHGVVVVSGVALGIDAQAHRGALVAGGLTAGVLGCGIDVIYPKVHQGLYKEISHNGVLVSEYPCGTRPDGFRFPARNRIISGLVRGVVVVEATVKSGSLITARLALDQGKEVFAVPGRIDSVKSGGTHRLLQQGAHLVQGIDDIFNELNLSTTFSASPLQAPAEKSVQDKDEQCLLDSLDVYPTDIDTIVRVTGLEVGRVLDLLLQLEMKGLVRQQPGQLFEKITVT